VGQKGKEHWKKNTFLG